MFCPLCKSEFRDGVAQCSDCRIPLVASQAEAAADFVWQGDNRKLSNKILDTLIAADIPNHSQEILKRRVWPWLSIVFWQFMAPRPTCEFKIFVLHNDLDRAKVAVKNCVAAELHDLDFDSEDPE